jgi:hypothetical protein
MDEIPGYYPPPPEVLAERLNAADRGAGYHLWSIVGVWAAKDPRQRAPEEMPLLDSENLLWMTGTSCFKCAQAFSNRVAKQPCRGSINVTEEDMRGGR